MSRERERKRERERGREGGGREGGRERERGVHVCNRSEARGEDKEVLYSTIFSVGAFPLLRVD